MYHNHHLLPILWQTMHLISAYRISALIAGAYSHAAFQWYDENLAVTDIARSGA